MVHEKTRPSAGRRLAGIGIVAVFVGLIVACVPAPVVAPTDPDIPNASSTPAFPNLTNPPTTAGPSTPPTPTTAPGDFAYGDTIVIHTDQGTTWEITPLQSIDPADSVLQANGYQPTQGSRAVILELTIRNVGVVTTHPYYDMAFAYQPDNAPRYDQNSGALVAAPDDLGYYPEIAIGESVTAEIVVQVPESAPEGSWVIGDGTSEYRFR
ncbi:hypothetical protein [Agrococcus versicolor]|uniref:hypothetical protein n=1 Tax=Agrococcus versicolor TaxID=501482 RepID=UPI0031D1DF73